jgi:hypothetical protein
MKLTQAIVFQALSVKDDENNRTQKEFNYFL